MILHLGVIDIPYAQAPKSRRAKRASGTQTTGDVAGWLENRYHVMEIFFEEHRDDVVADLEAGLAGHLEDLMSGATSFSKDAFGSATSRIEDRFKQFLSSKEIEGLGYPGVPTGAAQRGVDHRKKHPYAKRAPRPSFIDTGLYQASFKAWVDP